MRPRRSQRYKRPSTQALEALVSSSPQRPRRQSAAVDGGCASPAKQPSLLPKTMASPSSTTTATFMLTAATHGMLASTMLEQLVSRVSDEVTRRLQPLLGGQISQPTQGSNPVSTPGGSSHSTEFHSYFSSTNCLDTSCATGPCAVHFVQLPGSTPIPDTVEVPAVHDGVHTVLTSLSGEHSLLPGTQRPNDVFLSVNLPIEARLPAKLRIKIIQNEFVDFGSLLVNPALEDKFHITLQPSREGSSSS